MEFGRVPLHSLCGNSPEFGRPHLESQVRQSGFVDTGAGGQSSADGELTGSCRLRGISPRHLAAASN